MPTWTRSCRYCICDYPCLHPLQQEFVSTLTERLLRLRSICVPSVPPGLEEERVTQH